MSDERPDELVPPTELRPAGGPEQPEPTFEEAQAELEQIVARLEQGQASLDDAIALWERGEELYAFCKQRLDSAQGKVEELARRVEQTKPEPAA